jgi:hypothetical protein
MMGLLAGKFKILSEKEKVPFEKLAEEDTERKKQ